MQAPQLLEDMLEEVKHVTHLRRHHLHVLLTPLLTNWSSHGIGDILIAFRLLSIRCKNLRKLNVSYLRHMNPNVLMGLVPCFSKLVSLNLRMTLTVDQLLGQIGLACPNLLELNLAATPITDKGLVQLCVAEDGHRLCQKLCRLVVADTAVTTAGVTVVLQSLPNLREFDYDHIFDVLDLVENWDQGLETRLFMSAGVRLSAEPTKPPSRLPLTTLISVAEHVPIQSLETAARLCPETRTVTLSNAWLPSEALYKLMMMEHLTSLSLTNSEGLTLDFHEGVLPLLAVCGEKLQNLILANFTFVDIAGIGRTCLDLQNLAFSNIAEFEPVGQPCDEWFNQLHALELWSDPHADLSPYMIRQLLLFSPNMTNMLFKGCEVLSDKLMTGIWEVNPMPKLSHLTLDHCHTITGQILQHVLNADNELTVLRVWNCLNITKCLHTELVHHIKNENLDVYFEWFEYDD